MMGWSFVGSMLKSTVGLSPLPQRREVRREQSIVTRLISTWEVGVREGGGEDNIYYIWSTGILAFMVAVSHQKSPKCYVCSNQVKHHNYATPTCDKKVAQNARPSDPLCPVTRNIAQNARPSDPLCPVTRNIARPSDPLCPDCRPSKSS